MQKFREQIKIWQSNDYIKTLALSGNSLVVKLNENKRSIEEAMETYKDVERSSKLKTFSNQSILLSAIDQQNSLNRDSDDDDDSDNDFDFETLEEYLSEIDDDEELIHTLPVEYIDQIKFIKLIVTQLNQQTQKFNSEFEKLLNKKLRKNNLSIIEAKKEKINQLQHQHKFYIKRLLKIIKLIKNLRFNEMNLLTLIKDDLLNYVETNESYDQNLFDDIINSVSVDDSYSEFNDSEVTKVLDNTTENDISMILTTTNPSSTTNIIRTPISLSNITNESPDLKLDTATPSRHNNGHSNGFLKDINISTNNIIDNSNITTPIEFNNHVLNKSIQSSPILSSPETENSAIIKSLKPASTPSKPVGNLQWSTAAAVGIPEPSHDQQTFDFNTNNELRNSNSNGNGHKESLNSTPTRNLSTKFQNQPDVSDQNYSYTEVLKNSSLSPIEISLFSDLNLVKIPPGIQDLIISFTAKRNNSDSNKLIYDSKTYNPFVTPIRKPYLPAQVQPSLLKPSNFKPLLQSFKLQSCWNRIRANNEFDQIVLEIESLSNQTNLDNILIANELCLVLFYGYYYGLTPVENFIAESCLFKLGWKPYKFKADGSTILHSQGISSSEQNNNSFLYWLKQIKLISSEQDQLIEFGDYHVFDLSTWEFHIKYGFKFDYKYCQIEQSKSCC